MDHQYTVLPNVAIKFRIREVVRSNLGQEVKSFLHTAVSLAAGVRQVPRIRPQALPSASLPLHGPTAKKQSKWP